MWFGEHRLAFVHGGAYGISAVGGRGLRGAHLRFYGVEASGFQGFGGATVHFRVSDGA